MWETVGLWNRYAAISMRGQMQYRASFFLASIGQFMITSIEIVGIWALFDRFDNLQGWTLTEVALFYGMVNTGYAVVDALAPGFDHFGQIIKQGDFDRLLLRPRGTVLQLAGYEMRLMRIGRLAQGLLVLIWALRALDLDWSIADFVLLLGSLTGTICLFYGLLILQATLAFWTTETLEIMNTVSYGGVETAQYPMPIYAKSFRRFFTFIVPLACVTYFPIVAVLDRPDPLGTPAWFQWLSPAAGVAFLLVSLQVWKLGVRHYTSTGS